MLPRTAAPLKAGGPASGRGGLPELLSPSAQGCGCPGLPGAVEDVASCWPSSKDQRSLLVTAAQPEGRKALPTKDVFLVSCLAGLRALGQATSSLGGRQPRSPPWAGAAPWSGARMSRRPGSAGKDSVLALRSAVRKHPCPAASDPPDCVRSPGSRPRVRVLCGSLPESSRGPRCLSVSWCLVL